MKLELTVNPKQVTATVDKIVGGRLGVIVAKELGSFVEGHLARRRLSGKAPTDLVELIDKRLNLLVKSEVNRQMRGVRRHVEDVYSDRINAEVRKIVSAQAKKLRAQMLQESTDAR